MTTQGAAYRWSPKISGLTQILIATVVAGIASYVVTWLVPRAIGFTAYATFALFWSSLYLLVGALSGIQQEVTRASRAAVLVSAPRVSKASNFAIVAGVVVFVAVCSTAAIWSSAVFPRQEWSLVLPLGLGAASYVLVAAVAGSLYGIGRWGLVAAMIAVDSLARLSAVGIALIFNGSVVGLAWAVVLPFPITLVMLWPFIRNTLVGRTVLDVGYRRLTRNVAQTITAAAATGLMVSGFPLVLGLTSPHESKQVLGLFILSITLTRAPLITVLMSLQSYFVVAFRDNSRRLAARSLVILGGVVGLAVVLAIAAWLAGPFMFESLFPGELVPQGWLLAVLVLSSALVGVMSVTGSAVLARARHFIYSAGWIVGALVTLVALLLPLEFTVRVVAALLAGPIAGLAVHTTYLARARSTSNQQSV